MSYIFVLFLVVVVNFVAYFIFRSIGGSKINKLFFFFFPFSNFEDS